MYSGQSDIALNRYDRRGRACFASFLLANRYVEHMTETLQRAVPIQEFEIVVHRALWRRSFGAVGSARKDTQRQVAKR
jgi:hypothetical protein